VISEARCSEEHNRDKDSAQIVVGIDARVCMMSRRGWARYAREVILALSSLDGLQLKVLVPQSQKAAAWVEDIRPPHSVVSVPFEPESPDRYWDADSCSPEEWLGPVDILHSLCRFVPPTTVRPVVATVHDIVPLVTPPFKLEYREATAKALKKLRQPYCWITAVSNQTRRELVRFGGIDDRRIRVIYEGVSEIFTKEHDPQIRDRILPLDIKSCVYFIYVGGAGLNKNLHSLIAAFEEVYRQSRAKLVLVGDRSWGYSDIFADHDLPDWVCFVDYISDERLCALYQGAYAVVLPSFHEGFGLPIIEAMALGVPVLCSDIAVFREVASEFALYFDPNDLRMISQSVLHFLQDFGLRRRLVQLGRERAALFSWEKTARLTLNYYKFIRTQYLTLPQ